MKSVSLNTIEEVIFSLKSKLCRKYTIVEAERREDMNKQEKLEMLYKRLDNLEGCEDNPVYAKEIREIRSQINEIENS